MGRTNLRQDYSTCPSLPVGTGETELIVSRPIPTSAATAHSLSVYFQVDSAVVGSGENIIVRMQHEIASGCWIDVGQVASVSVDVDGIYAIRLDRGVPVEALVLPLGQPVRLVAETGGTSSFNITNINAMVGV